MHPNPWTRLERDWPQITVQYCDLGRMTHGLTTWYEGVPVSLALHERLTQRQRRVALTHELEHLDRGAPCHTLRASIEQRVLNATARWLLPDIDMIAEAMAVYDLHQAAEELWVTFSCLVTRLRTMSLDQLDYIAQRRLEGTA